MFFILFIKKLQEHRRTTDTILTNKTNLISETGVDSVESFQQMLNTSIDKGKKKVNLSGKRTRSPSPNWEKKQARFDLVEQGSGDHQQLPGTLSRETILDVKTQEMNSKLVLIQTTSKTHYKYFDYSLSTLFYHFMVEKKKIKNHLPLLRR